MNDVSKLENIINVYNKHLDDIDLRIDIMQRNFDKKISELIIDIKKLNDIITEPIDSTTIVVNKLNSLIRKVTENGAIFSIQANRLIQIKEEIQEHKNVTREILSEVNDIYKTFKDNNLL